MTTIMDYETVCSVCGKKSTQATLGSSNQFGSPDLDFRPSEMYRSTIGMWVTECPNCGYVAVDLEEELGIDKEYLRSEEYLSCDGINFKSKLSKRFYKEYLIASKKGEEAKPFFSMVYCIWSCDDARDIENAKYTRQIAIKLANKILEKYKDADKIILMKADFLRRIGEFDQVIKEYENKSLNDEDLDKIIEFQVKKACEKDSECYTMDEVAELEF